MGDSYINLYNQLINPTHNKKWIIDYGNLTSDAFKATVCCDISESASGSGSGSDVGNALIWLTSANNKITLRHFSYSLKIYIIIAMCLLIISFYPLYHSNYILAPINAVFGTLVTLLVIILVTGAFSMYIQTS